MEKKLIDIARAAPAPVKWDTFVRAVLDSYSQAMTIIMNMLCFEGSAEAERRYAERLGRDVATLTEAERKQAFMDAILGQGK